ncbi:MAG: conjugal transfer protein TraG N-terminal domain-containing protein, partial [Desulforegulaceae bacterium]|nr:conjugal transfer protein TraG N-terminal domain-containing protein [Desulforegulaceae bacterium]
MLTKKIFLFYPVVFIISIENAFADMPDFLKIIYARMDFNSVLTAYQHLALICNSPIYKGMFVGFFLLSVLFSALKAGGGILFSTKQGGDIKSFMILPILLFSLIFVKTFIFKTTDIVIHDKSSGHFETVANVPDIIVLISGFISSIEDAFVEIISSLALYESDMNYNQNATGALFNIAANLQKKGINHSFYDERISRELNNYIKDCLWFEMGRPGTTLNWNDIKANTNYIPVFEKAARQNIMTKDSDGTSLTCKMLWNDSLKPALNFPVTATDDVAINLCRQSGIFVNTSIPSTVTNCRKSLEGSYSGMIGQSISSNDLVRQTIISEALYKAISTGDNAAYINIKKAEEYKNILTATTEWLPHIQSQLFVVYLGLIPFLLIFMVTPLAPELLKFCFGVFVFFTCWSICDAVLYQAALAKALNLTNEIRNNKLGLLTYLTFSSDAAKGFAVFGQYKIVAMSMAGVVAALFTKAGSSLGRMTLSMGGQIAATGSNSAERMTFSRGQSLDALTASQGSMITHGNSSFNSMSNFARSAREQHMKAYETGINHFGGHDQYVERTGSVKGQGELETTVKGETRMNTVGDGLEGLLRHTEAIERAKISNELGQIEGATELGSTLDEIKKYQGKIQSAKTLGQNEGVQISGNIGFAKHDAYVKTAQSIQESSELDKLTDPLVLGSQSGQEKKAQAKTYESMTQEAGSRYAETAALNPIAATTAKAAYTDMLSNGGKISPETMNMVNALRQSDTGAALFQQEMAKGFSANLDPRQKEQLANAWGVSSDRLDGIVSSQGIMINSDGTTSVAQTRATSGNSTEKNSSTVKNDDEITTAKTLRDFSTTTDNSKNIKAGIGTQVGNSSLREGRAVKTAIDAGVISLGEKTDNEGNVLPQAIFNEGRARTVAGEYAQAMQSEYSKLETFEQQAAFKTSLQGYLQKGFGFAAIKASASLEAALSSSDKESRNQLTNIFYDGMQKAYQDTDSASHIKTLQQHESPEIYYDAFKNTMQNRGEYMFRAIDDAFHEASMKKTEGLPSNQKDWDFEEKNKQQDIINQEGWHSHMKPIEANPSSNPYQKNNVLPQGDIPYISKEPTQEEREQMVLDGFTRTNLGKDGLIGKSLSTQKEKPIDIESDNDLSMRDSLKNWWNNRKGNNIERISNIKQDPNDFGKANASDQFSPIIGTPAWLKNENSDQGGMTPAAPAAGR